MAMALCVSGSVCRVIVAPPKDAVLQVLRGGGRWGMSISRIVQFGSGG